jgi:hypothetical protein
MSSIGLNTNTFRVTGKYLDLLNDILVKAKVNQGITEGKKDQLIEFVTNVGDSDNIQPQFQLLASIIERELRSDHKKPDTFFSSFLQEIHDNNIDAFLPKVSFIAEALDTENSVALAKIKG